MSGKRVSVRGYYRSDGTYVKGYTRAAPSSPDTVQVSGYYRSNGTYVEPHTRSAPRSRGSDCSQVSGSCSAGSSGVKCYKDNALNRRLGRVGKPHGTHVLHEDGSVSVSKSGRGINRQELEESEELCHDCYLGFGHPTTYTARSTYDDYQYALEREEVQERPRRLRGTDVQAPNASCRSRPENHTVVEPRPDSGTLGSRHPTTPTATYDDYQNALYRLEQEEVQEHPSRLRGTTSSTDVQALKFSRSRPENHTVKEFRRDSGNLGSRHPIAPTATYQNARSERDEVQGHRSKLRGITPSTDVQVPNASCISRPEKFIPYSELRLDKEKIGRGGFSKVYAGLWHGTPIAYKKLLLQQLSKKLKRSFENEVTVLSTLEHPNIVKMFGVVTEEGYRGIVMERLVRTIYRAVFEDEAEFTAEKKKQIVNQIASGLAYLHNKENIIAHRDLKSENVLLDRGDNAKLADFGLSTLKNATESSQSEAVPGCQGTPRYSAPEVLRGEILSIKQHLQADVYSLGVTVFEIVVEEEVYEDLNPRQIAAHVGRGTMRPPTDTLSRSVAQLLSSCWNGDAKSRPTAEIFLEEWRSIHDLTSFSSY